MSKSLIFVLLLMEYQRYAFYISTYGLCRFELVKKVRLSHTTVALNSVYKYRRKLNGKIGYCVLIKAW